MLDQLIELFIVSNALQLGRSFEWRHRRREFLANLFKLGKVTGDLLIHFQKSLLERSLVLLVLEAGMRQQNLRKVSLAVLGDFYAPMAIKYCE